MLIVAEKIVRAMLLEVTGTPASGGPDDIMNVVEIEVQNIAQYHQKGVIANVMSGTRPVIYEGVMFVGENSRWMRIDFFAGTDAQGKRIVKPFYVTQEIADSITPASKEVLNNYGGRISFVIQRVLPPPS